MLKKTWRQELFKEIVSYCDRFNVDPESNEDLYEFIRLRARQEAKPNYTGPTGYQHVMSFTDMGLKRFLNDLRANWPSYHPRKKRINNPDLKIIDVGDEEEEYDYFVSRICF